MSRGKRRFPLTSRIDGLLPFPQVIKVILKFSIRDENGMPVMASLDDMMRIAGYYYS